MGPAGAGGSDGRQPEGNGGQRQQEREREPVRTGQTNQKWESLVQSLGHLSTAMRGHRRERGTVASRHLCERGLQARPDLDGGRGGPAAPGFSYRDSIRV